jgi:hypothetical protein
MWTEVIAASSKLFFLQRSAQTVQEDHRKGTQFRQEAPGPKQESQNFRKSNANITT